MIDLYKTKSVPLILNGKKGIQTTTGRILSIFVIIVTSLFLIYSLLEYFLHTSIVITQTQTSTPSNITAAFPIEVAYVWTAGIPPLSNYPTCSQDMRQAMSLNFENQIVYYTCDTLYNHSQNFGPPGRPYKSDGVCLLSYVPNLEDFSDAFTPYVQCSLLIPMVVAVQSQTVLTDSGFIFSNIHSQTQPLLIFKTNTATTLQEVTFIADYEIIYSRIPKNPTMILSEVSAIFTVAFTVALIIGTVLIDIEKKIYIMKYMNLDSNQMKINPYWIFLAGYIIGLKGPQLKLKKLKEAKKQFYQEIDIKNFTKFDAEQNSSFQKEKNEEQFQIESKESFLDKYLIDLYAKIAIPLIQEAKEGLSTRCGKIISFFSLGILIAYTIYGLHSLFTQNQFQVQVYNKFVNVESESQFLPEVAFINPFGTSQVFQPCSSEMQALLQAAGYSPSLAQCAYNITQNIRSYQAVCVLTHVLNLQDWYSPFSQNVICTRTGGIPYVHSYDIYYYNVETDYGLIFPQTKQEAQYQVNFIYSDRAVSGPNIFYVRSPKSPIFYRTLNTLFPLLGQIGGVWSTVSLIIGTLALRLSMIEQAIMIEKRKNTKVDYSVSEYISGMVFFRSKIIMKYKKLVNKSMFKFEASKIFSFSQFTEKVPCINNFIDSEEPDHPFTFDLFSTNDVPFSIQGKEKIETKSGKILSVLFIVISAVIFALVLYQNYNALTITTQIFALTSKQVSQLQNIEVFYLPTGYVQNNNCPASLINQAESQWNTQYMYCPPLNVAAFSSQWQGEVCFMNSLFNDESLYHPIVYTSSCFQKLDNYQCIQSQIVQIVTDLDPIFSSPNMEQMQFNQIVSQTSIAGFGQLGTYTIVDPVGTRYMRIRKKLITILGSIKGLCMGLFALIGVVGSKMMKTEKNKKLYTYFTGDKYTSQSKTDVSTIEHTSENGRKKKSKLDEFEEEFYKKIDLFSKNDYS